MEKNVDQGKRMEATNIEDNGRKEEQQELNWNLGGLDHTNKERQSPSSLAKSIRQLQNQQRPTISKFVAQRIIIEKGGKKGKEKKNMGNQLRGEQGGRLFHDQVTR